MERFYHIDWMSVTLPFTDEPQEYVPQLPGLEKKDDIRPTGYYNSAYETECGAIVRWHTQVPTQGINVLIKGAALGKMYAEHQIGNTELIQAFYGIGAKVARLDFASDLMGYRGVSGIKELISDFRAGKCISRIKQIYEYKSEDKHRNIHGDTLYIGSMHSEKFVRVYDKSLQMKLLSEAWLRVELQTEGRIADALFHDMAEREGGSSPSEVGRRWVKAHCNFPECEWWTHLFASDVPDGEISKVPRKETSFEAYLKQVYKVIANHMETNADRALIERFLGDCASLFT